MNAVIYCRISRDPDHTELGVKRQEKDCRALCERDGLDIAEVVVDDDRSAYSGKRRPGYEHVLDIVRDGLVSVVVAWHPDRITRSPKELETLIDLLEASKVKVRTCQAGEYDLATPSGRMTARVVGAVARSESEHKSARLRRKHLELAENGKNSGGGTRPFGYEADRITVNKAEAKLVRAAAADILSGASIRGIAAGWTARGIATPTGATWKPTVVRTLLLSARIAGIRKHRSGTYKAEWQPIITDVDHRSIVAILTDPARRLNGNPHSYLLTGYGHCGLCGARLVARPKDDKRRCYVCSSGPGFDGCGKIRTLSEPVEDLVVEAVLTRFDGPALAAAINAASAQSDDIDDDLELVDAKLVELADMWSSGELDRVSWNAARKPLEAAKAAHEARLRQSVTRARIAPYTSTQGALRAAWPDLSFDQKRAVLATVLESVIVGPAVKGRNFFDPSRVSVKWKA